MLKNFFLLYIDGFKNLTVGKTLWFIIILKLVIMFGVFKLFFFQETLSDKYNTTEQISDHIRDQLTKI